MHFISSFFHSLDVWHPFFFLIGLSVGLGIKMSEKDNDSTNDNGDKNFPVSKPKPPN